MNVLSLLLKMPRNNVRDRRGDLPRAYTPIYFSESEFNLLTPSCSLDDMDDNFMRKLDELRQCVGFPLTLTCAFRSVEFDKSKGRSGNSYHCAGRAVDIYCSNSDKRLHLVLMAHRVGLCGIGVAHNFVHVDDRDLPALWTYDK